MEEKLEEVVEETTQQTTEQVEETPQVDESKFESAGDDSVIKVDLSKPPTPKENETKEDNADDSGVVAESENADAPQEQEKVQPEDEAQETPVVEEITDEEKVVEEKAEEIADEAEKAIAESEATGKPLPENIQGLVDFMNDTGGDIVDYVNLTQDYSQLNDQDLLYEYYRATKPHLENDEINFLLEDQFSYDEEVDEDKDIKRKKLALKEQVASAKSHLDGLKSQYYQEIKAGSKLTSEQQKAVEFFDRYKKTTQESKQQSEHLSSTFDKRTNEFFGDKFKGFEYNVGDKKFRFNVKDAGEVKDTQSNVNNFVGKFLNKKSGALEDAAGYHKALFTGMNSDAIAKHFYEQGKADAMKNSVAKSKNISMNPRQSHGEAKINGPTFKVLGEDTASFKFKVKNKNK